ncbi:YjzD family protein [Vagococcus sp. JNUCC 83]
MGRIVVFIWAILLGQVVSYIGGALHGVSDYNFTGTVIVSLIACAIVMLIGEAAAPSDQTKAKK